MMNQFYKRISLNRSSQLDGSVVNRDGFTLVEILMVLFILSVGVLPLAVIQHRARRDVTDSDNFTKAMLVAQEQLELAKGLGFGNAVSDSGDVDNTRWVRIVTNQSFGLDRIELTTSWQTEGGVRTMVLADIVSMR